MSTSFPKSLGLAILTGLALGGLYSGFEFVKHLAQDNLVRAGRESLVTGVRTV